MVVSNLTRSREESAGATSEAMPDGCNVTGIIDRLVAEGMVVRLAHEADRRATFARLTRSGCRQFQAMAKAHEAWVDEILADLGGDATETLIELLSTPAFKQRPRSAAARQEVRNVR